MIQEQEVISIGVLRRPHGKKGELQCQIQNEYWEEAGTDRIILKIESILVPFRVLEWRGKGTDTLIMRLKGIDTEQRASALTGTEVYMLRQDIANDIDTELTWQSLVGYHVVDTDQGKLGEIEDVDESTINTLITLSNGRLLPIHEDFICDIDTENQILTLTLPFIID